MDHCALFTPGPIRIVQSTDPNHPDIRLIAGTEVIATIHHLGRNREQEFHANAVLMGTAGHLFDALQTITDMESDRKEDARNFENTRIGYWKTLLTRIQQPVRTLQLFQRRQKRAHTSPLSGPPRATPHALYQRDPL